MKLLTAERGRTPIYQLLAADFFFFFFLVFLAAGFFFEPGFFEAVLEAAFLVFFFGCAVTFFSEEDFLVLFLEDDFFDVFRSGFELDVEAFFTAVFFLDELFLALFEEPLPGFARQKAFTRAPSERVNELT